eukprot:11203398-Lingulodinium_polyedra.AAC.1
MLRRAAATPGGAAGDGAPPTQHPTAAHTRRLLPSSRARLGARMRQPRCRARPLAWPAGRRRLTGRG